MIAVFMLGLLLGWLLGAHRMRRFHRDVERVLATAHAAEVRQLTDVNAALRRAVAKAGFHRSGSEDHPPLSGNAESDDHA